MPPGPTGPVQFVVPWKSAGPAIEPPEKVMVTPFTFFVFCEVLVSVATLDFLAPRFTVPKFSDAGDNFTEAATGVGVGVGVRVIVGVGVRVIVVVGVAVAVAVAVDVAVAVGVGVAPLLAALAAAARNFEISTVPQPVVWS